MMRSCDERMRYKLMNGGGKGVYDRLQRCKSVCVITFCINFIQRDDEIPSADFHEFSFQQFAGSVPSSNA